MCIDNCKNYILLCSSIKNIEKSLCEKDPSYDWYYSGKFGISL